eukprot:TRINITY_DN13655_c0_g1_i2.p1 TRINITY_DN13655_c0_g1~~TRINITY_DN13655_c0_g1_i2.p1  ORF type:complete len:109 (-),score=22.23 TRINITY_DN13655_c0_g1_i2:736-1062(-)
MSAIQKSESKKLRRYKGRILMLFPMGGGKKEEEEEEEEEEIRECRCTEPKRGNCCPSWSPTSPNKIRSLWNRTSFDVGQQPQRQYSSCSSQSHSEFLLKKKESIPQSV